MTIDVSTGTSSIRTMLQQGTIDEPGSRQELEKIAAAMGMPGLAQLSAGDLKLIFQVDTTSGVDAPNVPPGGFRYGAAADAVGRAGETSGVDMFAIFELFHAMGVQQRQSSREARQTALDAQMSALQNAADEIRTAAMFNLLAGITSGAMTIAGGLATVRAGSLSIQSGNAGGPTTAQGKTFEGMSQKWMGYGQVMQGSGQVGSAFFQYFAAQAEARKAEFDAEATKAGALRDNENEIAAATRDLIRDIQEKLAAMEQANHQTTLNILRV